MFVYPADTGVINPVLLTVATPVFEEVHVYVRVGVPDALEVNDKVLPIQTAFSPVIFPATTKLTFTAMIAEVA